MSNRDGASGRCWGWLLVAMLGAACAKAENIQEEILPSSVKGPPLEAGGPAWKKVAPVMRVSPEDAPDDPALHRVYGPGDMSLADCAKRLEDGTIVGSHCSSGFVVFGPYARTPKKSEIRVSFELRALSKLELASDLVSNANHSLGTLEADTMKPGESRKIAYRMHVTEALAALEGRVWVAADAPMSFEIKNLSVAVQ